MEYVKRLLLVLHWFALAGAAGAGIWAIAGIGAWLIYGAEMYEMIYGADIYEYGFAYDYAAGEYWGISLIPLLLGLVWLILLTALRFIAEGKVIIFPWQQPAP